MIPDIDSEHHPSTWAELLRRHRVTVWNSAPALADLLLDHLEHAAERRSYRYDC